MISNQASLPLISFPTLKVDVAQQNLFSTMEDDVTNDQVRQIRIADFIKKTVAKRRFDAKIQNDNDRA